MKNTFTLSTLLLILLSIIIFPACPYDQKYTSGSFPTSAVNFEEINTEYDDYNSTAPSFRKVFPLCFSSNRNSLGEEFDIIYKLIAIDFNKSNGILKVYNELSQNIGLVLHYEDIHQLVDKANSENNEFGPYIKNMGIDLLDYYGNIYTYSDELSRQSLLLFAREKNENLDIMFISDIENEMEEPISISYINTEYNEAYPSFTSDLSSIIYCSDQGGKYDFYQVPFDRSIKIQDAFTDTIPKTKTKLETLSSSDDDKCPYIEENIIVFASNREGGYGGYDLYYSIFSDNTWSEPINFGSRINTEYDEFRPMLKFVSGFDNDFLLFSSNRPGGKGGFDLYYIGIDINQ